jgi:hypothetical protein
MSAVVYDCAAFTVVARESLPPYKGGCVELLAGDYVACALPSRSHGMQFHKFGVDTVVSYAIKNGRCPIDAVEQATERKHELHFLFPTGTMITAHKREPETLVFVELGMRVKLQGRFFTVRAANNDNLYLEPVA